MRRPQPDNPGDARRRAAAAVLALVLSALPGCAVVAVGGAVVGAAISVTGAVVSTSVKAVGAGIEALSSDDADADDSGLVIRYTERPASAASAGSTGAAFAGPLTRPTRSA